MDCMLWHSIHQLSSSAIVNCKLKCLNGHQHIYLLQVISPQQVDSLSLLCGHIIYAEWSAVDAHKSLEVHGLYLT